jgi:hypothetical protein
MKAINEFNRTRGWVVETACDWPIDRWVNISRYSGPRYSGSSPMARFSPLFAAGSPVLDRSRSTTVLMAVGRWAVSVCTRGPSLPSTVINAMAPRFGRLASIMWARSSIPTSAPVSRCSSSRKISERAIAVIAVTRRSTISIPRDGLVRFNFGTNRTSSPW